MFEIMAVVGCVLAVLMIGNAIYNKVSRKK